MTQIDTKDPVTKAYVYRNIFIDRLVTLNEYILAQTSPIGAEWDSIRRRLCRARDESRIYPDEEHFSEWDKLIDEVDIFLENKA